jgi:hypothetical protein
MRRRDVLKLGLAAGGSGLLARRALAADPKELLRFLCPPDGEPPDLATPSPPAREFVAELFVPPIKQPVASLDPPPDPRAHQRYDEFPPKKLYEIHEQEFDWVYHPDPPYDRAACPGVSTARRRVPPTTRATASRSSCGASTSCRRWA